MKIVVLSKKKTFYSTRRLITSAEQKGHKVIFIDLMKCNVTINENEMIIYYKNKRLNDIDLVLTRIGFSITNYGLSVVRQFEKSGSKVINSSAGISNSHDKMRSLQLLAVNRIAVPKTVMTLEPGNIAKALQIVGGIPVVLKPQFGSQGRGIILAESIGTVNSYLENLWSLKQNILIQQYISESKGKDIRAFVIKDRVVASMRRIARKGDFRSNIHRGGVGEIVELPKYLKKIAVRAAKILKLDIAGVDIFETSNGPLIVEVNSSPGFEELEKISGVNIGKMIVDYAVLATEKHCSIKL